METLKLPKNLQLPFEDWKDSKLDLPGLLIIMKASQEDIPTSEWECFLENFEAAEYDLDVKDDLEELFLSGDWEYNEELNLFVRNLGTWGVKSLLEYLNKDDPDFPFKDELIEWLMGYLFEYSRTSYEEGKDSNPPPPYYR